MEPPGVGGAGAGCSSPAGPERPPDPPGGPGGPRKSPAVLPSSPGRPATARRGPGKAARPAQETAQLFLKGQPGGRPLEEFGPPGLLHFFQVRLEPGQQLVPGPEAGGPGPGCPKPGPPGGPGCRPVAGKCSGPVAVPAKQRWGRRRPGGSPPDILKVFSATVSEVISCFKAVGSPRPGFWRGLWPGLPVRHRLATNSCTLVSGGLVTARAARREATANWRSFRSFSRSASCRWLSASPVSRALSLLSRSVAPPASTRGRPSGERLAAAICFSRPARL